MVELTSAHDKFISKNLEYPGVASGIVKKSLPVSITQYLDLNSLKMVKDTFIDEKLKEYFSDKLFKLDYIDDGWGYIYFLIEHKSQPDFFTSYQTLKYRIRIWDNVFKENKVQIKKAKDIEKKNKENNENNIVSKVKPIKSLPLIIPVVLYHGLTKWSVPHNFKFLIDPKRPPDTDRYIPDCEYKLFDLSDFNDDEFTGTVHYQVTMLLLKNISHDDIKKKFTGILRNEDETTSTSEPSNLS